MLKYMHLHLYYDDTGCLCRVVADILTIMLITDKQKNISSVYPAYSWTVSADNVDERKVSLQLYLTAWKKEWKTWNITNFETFEEIMAIGIVSKL